MKRSMPFLLLCIVPLAEPAWAQPGTSAPPDAEGLAKQLSNPIADLVSIPLQINWEEGVGVNNDLRTVTNFQPSVPVTLTDNWNVIGRVIMPYISQPALAPGAASASGTGDILFSAFFSPSKSKGVSWGVGPVVSLPTTTDPALGSGKWSAGPTFVVLKQSGPWTYGALANHLWSFADTGDLPRSKVNQTFLQPFLAYTTKTAVTFTLQSESTANWEAPSGDEWTVPVNFIVSKVIHLGPFAYSVGVGGGVFVEKPAGAPEWKLRLQGTLILPRNR